MSFTATSALIYVERRKLFDVFPDDVKQAWKKWEVQCLILFSLMFQVVLVVLGHKRKYLGKRTRIRFLIWSAYILADWVATVALGVLSQDTLEDNKQGGDRTAMKELMSFWTPFLLLHLGGPDTITAYAPQDNELWLRHLVGLVIQTGLALYILLVTLPGSSWLPILSILIFLAGLIKFLERTLALRLANTDRLRDSMLTSPDPGPNYAKFMEEYTLKKAWGFSVVTNEVREHPILIDDEVSYPADDAKKLISVAHDRFQRFKRLFVDLILSFQDRDSSQSYFLSLDSGQAFKVVEVELGLAFDMFYTKAPIVYSMAGCILRVFTFSCTFLALIFFVVLCERDKYRIINLILTYLLLFVAIIMEIYAVIIQLQSDWMVHWLRKHHKIREYLNGTCSEVTNRRRWSNSMAQYNLLSVCLEERPAVCYQFQRLLGLVEFREKHRYKTYVEVSPDLKTLIFDHFKKFATFQKKKKFAGENEPGPPALCTRRDSLALKRFLSEWTNQEEIEFDQSLLMWHIATDICYCLDEGHSSSDSSLKHRESKHLSDYMLHLLVLHPFTLPIGIGLIRFRDTCAEAKQFFKEIKFEKGEKKSKACDKLLQVNTEVLPLKVKGDRSKTVLFDACILAKKLRALDKVSRWNEITDVWVEMLAYAATHCRGNHHVQQLRKGGELLTHVWLLMAHFGITQQFQIYHGHARAKLVAK
ncbi:OLC1v1016083C1 [Oldenlandia corymbosa var. corymbosa]|uniref:OLC1v1016083C1 n=1 Tax=Oldenlandia corymbosa var. corymbosa TaxID=529605 RepID=A0AAV1E4R2_OLDCO|nr:OLC1v1016083C1 [Oldenlandia corymbosa var. corymbosa]